MHICCEYIQTGLVFNILQPGLALSALSIWIDSYSSSDMARYIAICPDKLAFTPTQATQVVYICIWKDKDLNTNTELKKTKGLEFHVLGNKMNQDPFEFTARFLNQGGYLVPHQKLEDV